MFSPRGPIELVTYVVTRVASRDGAGDDWVVDKLYRTDKGEQLGSEYIATFSNEDDAEEYCRLQIQKIESTNCPDCHHSRKLHSLKEFNRGCYVLICRCKKSREELLPK